MDFDTHGAGGLVGWYRRVYEGNDDDTVDELFDPNHKEFITASEIPTNLDDILLAILEGCHTADAPADGGDSMTTAVANSGVDIVFGWQDTQYSSMSLFVKFFLQRAYQKEYNGASVQWNNYPTVNEARIAAYEDLRAVIGDDADDPDYSNADYVDSHLVMSGSNGQMTAGNVKPYPPRHGAKDK